MREGCFGEKCHASKPFSTKTRINQCSLQENAQLVFTDGMMEITDELILYHNNECTKSCEPGSFGLTMIKDGEYQPDDFRHEQYLLIEENGKRILVGGCSHKGILNIAEWFEPDVFIGGFHFSKLPLDQTLKAYGEYLNQFNTDYYTCHCTIIKYFAFMKAHMNRLFYLSVGQSIIL